MALMYLPLYLVLLGICSTVLWLPALGVGIILLVRQPSCRRKLGVLFGLWGLSMVLLLGTVWAESGLSVRLRNWVYTVPVYFWGAVSIVLLIAVAWYAVQHFPRKWMARLVKVGCALSLFAVFTVGFFYLVVITRTEEVGTWQGEQVVMQKSSFRDATYSYYRYHGPFLLGESLGWSEEPWDLPEYR